MLAAEVPTISRWKTDSSYSASSKRIEKVWKRSPGEAAAERGDERAIQAAGEVAADGDVGPQHAQPNGFLEAALTTAAGVIEAPVERRGRHRPDSAAARTPCPDRHAR